jgi:hypothetical protein
MGKIVPIDFYAKGYLEQYTRRKRPGSYKRVKDGTLQELVEYACSRSRGLLNIYRITIGADTYTGQEIRNLFDDLNFPKRVKC